MAEPEPVAEILIQTEDLRREFGETVAVKDVNFVVEQGAVFALVGPNGAGKTTLLNMISGLLAPTSGTVRVSGLDVRSGLDLPPRTSPPSKLDSEPFEVHSTG